MFWVVFFKEMQTKIFQDMKEQCLIKGSGRNKWELLVLEIVLGTKFSSKTLAAKGKREPCSLYNFHIILVSVLLDNLLLGGFPHS